MEITAIHPIALLSEMLRARLHVSSVEHIYKPFCPVEALRMLGDECTVVVAH